MLNPDAAVEKDTAPLVEEPVTSGGPEEYNAFAPTAPEEQLEFVNAADEPAVETVPEDSTTVAGVWGRMTNSVQRLQTFRTSMTANLAPWTGFFNKNKMSVPPKSEVFKRVRYNLKIYHSNYMVVLAFLAAWTAISNLYFVLAMLSSVGAYYYYRMQTQDGTTFVFRGKEVSAAQFYALLTGVTLFFFWVTGGSSTMFWLVASALVSVFGHAAAREVSDEDIARIDSADGTAAQQAASALPSVANTASSWGITMPAMPSALANMV